MPSLKLLCTQAKKTKCRIYRVMSDLSIACNNLPIGRANVAAFSAPVSIVVFSLKNAEQICFLRVLIA